MNNLVTRRELLKIAGAAVGGTMLPNRPESSRATILTEAPFYPDVRGDDLVVRVEEVLGVPTFTVDKTPFTIPVFETYVPELQYYKEFAAAGTRSFEFSANSGKSDYNQSKPSWLAPNQWDYSEFDERVRRVLEAAPRCMIFPRVYIGTPDWWLRQNPDEMEILDDGSTMPGAGLYALPEENRPYPSIASQKWREDMGYGLKRLIEHIQGSSYAGHFFGYVLAGLKTEEWYHWGSGVKRLFGYGKPTVAAFREWLRNKYLTVEKLRTAWNNPQVDFQTAGVPSREERLGQTNTTFRDPSRSMKVIDFYVFWNELIPQTIDYFAGIAKKATKGTKVIGAYYAYMYEFEGKPDFGHNALGTYNASRNLDFVAATASYGDRPLGTGGDYQRAPALSLALHGKLWHHDNDVVSYLARKVMGRTYQDKKQMEIDLLRLGATKNATESVWMYRRGAGFALCTGMYEAFFDLHGGYFDAPELMDEIAKLNRMWDRAKRYDRSSNAEILIVSDENSCSYCSFDSAMLGQSLLPTQWQVIKIGAPADHILVDDLKLIKMERYKLVVFLNTYNLTDAQRDLVEKKVKNNGRSVLWCYAPGLFDGEQASPELMYRLTSLRIVPSPDEAFIAPQIELVDSKGPLSVAWRNAGLRTTGPDWPICKKISVEDPEAVTLGTLPGTASVTLAMRNLGSWSSFYAITPTLPAAFYRELARQAGVHIYNDRDDTFYANKSYIVLSAKDAGKRVIQFPRPCEVREAVTEQRLATQTRSYSYDFQNGETLILRWS
jgi:hypothetical protein